MSGQQLSAKSNNFISSFIEDIKNNKLAAALAIGIGAATLILANKYLTKKHDPDIARVIKLRQVIEKSYPNALKVLQTLNIEKEILTEYSSGLQGESIGENKNTFTQKQLNMLFLVMTGLKRKQNNKDKQLRNPFLPPFQQGLFISQLQPSHRLLYNRFNIYKNHLLVVTKQFQAQSSQINQQDFKQSILTLKALEGLLFFNSGPQAGSSQPHKHIQIFPKQGLDLPIVKQIIMYVKQKSAFYDFQKQQIFQFPLFNFVHGIIMLKPHPNLSHSKKKMHSAYKKILQHKIRSVNAAAYNILATEQFIFLVARRKQKAFDQIAINAVGFMGSLLFKEEQKLNKYLSLKIKPTSILEDITYPKNYKPSKIQENQKEGQ